MKNLIRKIIGDSSNGRTGDFESQNGGSIPSSPTKEVGLCFSCEKKPQKYVTGLCQTCHEVAINRSQAMMETFKDNYGKA